MELIFDFKGFSSSFLGAFFFPTLFEYYHTRDFGAAWRAGLGAVLGRMAGILLKLLVGISMMVAFIILLLKS